MTHGQKIKLASHMITRIEKKRHAPLFMSKEWMRRRKAISDRILGIRHKVAPEATPQATQGAKTGVFKRIRQFMRRNWMIVKIWWRERKFKKSFV